MRITSSRPEASVSGSLDDDNADAPLPTPAAPASGPGPVQRAARQAQLIEQFAAATFGGASAAGPSAEYRAEYLAEWRAWADEGGAAGGKRTEALRRMRACLESGTDDAELDLAALGFTPGAAAGSPVPAAPAAAPRADRFAGSCGCAAHRRRPGQERHRPGGQWPTGIRLYCQAQSIAFAGLAVATCAPCQA